MRGREEKAEQTELVMFSGTGVWTRESYSGAISAIYTVPRFGRGRRTTMLTGVGVVTPSTAKAIAAEAKQSLVHFINIVLSSAGRG